MLRISETMAKCITQRVGRFVRFLIMFLILSGASDFAPRKPTLEICGVYTHTTYIYVKISEAMDNLQMSRQYI